jgi:hypothetical protein
MFRIIPIGKGMFRATVRSKRLIAKLERFPRIQIIGNAVYFSQELLKYVQEIDKKKIKVISTVKQGELFK